MSQRKGREGIPNGLTIHVRNREGQRANAAVRRARKQHALRRMRDRNLRTAKEGKVCQCQPQTALQDEPE